MTSNMDYGKYTYIALTHNQPQSLNEMVGKPKELTYQGQIGSLADEHLFAVPIDSDPANACSWLTAQGARNVKVQMPKQRVKRDEF